MDKQEINQDEIKVVTVNCVYNRFSTGTLIKWIEEYAEKYGVEFLHYFEVGDEKSSNSYKISSPFWFKVNVKLSLILGWQYGMGTINTFKLTRKIKRYNPDIVHIHCPNARSVNLFYLIKWLGRNYPTVITNHAEYFYTGNCPHAEDCTGYLTGCNNCSNELMHHTHASWVLMKWAFKNFKKLVMVTVSPWQKKRLDASVIANGQKSITILNGVDTNVFYYRSYVALSHNYKMFQGKKNIVFVTSMYSDVEGDLKGGWYVRELAIRNPNINIIVAGTQGQIINSKPDNLFLLGYIEDSNKIAELFSLADLSIMTSRRETFGMALAESLCCGTPVVGFENGGSDSSALSEYTSFVPYGDLDKLEQEIYKWIDKKNDIRNMIIENAQEKYSKERMGREYLQLYKDILKGGY